MSCLHCSPTFKKLFPEYVERYNKQQALEKMQPESRQEDSKPLVKKLVNSSGEDDKTVDTPKGRRNKKQPLPTWMMLLLVSVFGMIMALPLLQL